MSSFAGRYAPTFSATGLKTQRFVGGNRTIDALKRRWCTCPHQANSGNISARRYMYVVYGRAKRAVVVVWAVTGMC